MHPQFGREFFSSKPQFSIETDLFGLSARAKKTVERVMKKIDPKHGQRAIYDLSTGVSQFRGITLGEKLIGFIIFNPTRSTNGSAEKKCLVEGIWKSKGAEAKKFREEFQVPPNEYLLDDLVRMKFSVIRAPPIHVNSERLRQSLLKQGLIKGARRTFKPTPLWHTSIGLRRKIPQQTIKKTKRPLHRP